MICLPVPSMEAWLIAGGILVGIPLLIMGVRAWNDRWRED